MVPKPNKSQRAIALFDCTADESRELTFKTGDAIVDGIYRRGCGYHLPTQCTVNLAPEEGDGWYSGTLEKSAVSGLFPGNYVRFVAVIAEEEDDDSLDEAPVTAKKDHSPMAAYKSAFKAPSAAGSAAAGSSVRSVSPGRDAISSNPTQNNWRDKGREMAAIAKEKALEAREKAMPLAHLAKEKAGATLATVQGRIAQFKEDSLERKNSEGAGSGGVGGGPVRPAKPVELMATVFKTKLAGNRSSSPSEAEPPKQQAPWMSQVQLKPVNTSSSAPAPQLPPRDATVAAENDPFVSISSANAAKLSSIGLSKRAPPPPPPTSSSASLAAKLSTIPGLGFTPDTDLQRETSSPSLTRSKPPPPPPPFNRTATQQGQLPPDLTPEHLRLYEAAFADFVRMFSGMVDVNGGAALSAKQVRTVWLRSRVDARTLAKIWRIVVNGSTTRQSLNKSEFCFGLYLIDGILAGKTLP
ncbi:hypothetical protein BC830DRAFT_1079391 [Chytriomyces sp. MP71]|nr:hypothetical protein BC830DRAFT_1079391 [Chytriomyces sp. MP71]